MKFVVIGVSLLLVTGVATLWWLANLAAGADPNPSDDPDYYTKK